MFKSTIDHREIQKWAEKYGAKPEIIDRTDALPELIGLRLNFPGVADDELLSEDKPPKETNWDDFFHIFESNRLAFEYDEKPVGQDPSMWYRFTRRENILAENGPAALHQ